MAQESFTFAEIEGQPSYRIGLDLGIFIFTTPDGRWHVRWNGNEKGQRPIRFFYLWGGDITATHIINVSSYKFDQGQPDNFSMSHQSDSDTLNFNGVVFSDEDGLDFDIDADEVHFALTGQIKDQNNAFLHPGLIFMGPNKLNPTANSFVVTRNAPPPPSATPTLFWTDSGPADIQNATLTDSPAAASLISMPYTAYGFALDPVGRKMYWSDSGKTISVANLDGTDTSVLVSGLGFVPYGLALDMNHNLAYCADQHGGVIYSVDLSSGQATAVVSGLSGPVDLALDLAASKIYWVEYNGSSVGCAGLDGSGLAHPLTGLTFPQGITLDTANGLLYGADKTSIWRANLDGSNIAMVASLPDALGNMLSRRVVLDTTASMLYWTDRGTFVIQKIDATATNGSPQTVLSSLPSPALLAPPLYS
jgi:hypothetical protein